MNQTKESEEQLWAITQWRELFKHMRHLRLIRQYLKMSRIEDKCASRGTRIQTRHPNSSATQHKQYLWRTKQKQQQHTIVSPESLHIVDITNIKRNQIVSEENVQRSLREFQVLYKRLKIIKEIRNQSVEKRIFICRRQDFALKILDYWYFNIMEKLVP